MNVEQERQEAIRLQGEGLTRREIAARMGISFRAVKRRLEGARKPDPAISEAMAAVGATREPRAFWAKQQPDGSILHSVLIGSADDDSAAEFEAVIDGACERLSSASPIVVSPVDYKGGDHMLVLSPADIHMGKLSEAMETGDEYTQKIAEQRTKEAVAGLLTVASGFGIECITVNTGNDALHIDNSRKTTTSGTPQDTDGSIFSMFDAMLDTWVWVISEAAKYAPVHVVFDPSNHPWVSDWMLNRAVMAWFKNDDRITFDVKMNAIRHRKYQVYGVNLIGYSHGDGCRPKDLPHVMQHEAREWWGKTQRGYWIIKHRHHKDAHTVGLSGYEQEKDGMGITVIRSGDMQLDKNVSVEVVRSPSGTDGWHDRNAFVGAIKAVECFLFHATRGQVARFTYPFY